ncbi:2-dehydropantoate 2-reductase [Streptomyces sp. NPDC047108]|uniref:2-dehydropantoate 2-reductase n=1 Tax=Streptomyces sp. NPDC047108 TaxID=3155025 RepID=UPI0033F81194
MTERPVDGSPTTSPRLSIAVLGAGSIGCHTGGLLAETAGVTLIGRSAAMETLRRNGLALTGGSRSAKLTVPGDLRVATGPDAAAGADYVLITVKSSATSAAARELAPHLGPSTVVVSLQNGLHNTAAIRRELPEHTVLAGTVPYNVVQREPGVFHQGSAGPLSIEEHERAAPLMSAFRAAGLAAETRGDMREVQYAKLLINLNNALNALSDLPLRAELSQRAYRRCFALCQTEALTVLRAAGAKPARLTPVPARYLPYMLRLPNGLFRIVAASTLRIDAHARSSMWEDLQRGRRTEIDELQGEVVALAGRHGLEAPVNARLVELIREAEEAGPDARRRWSGPDLWRELVAARQGGATPAHDGT